MSYERRLHVRLGLLREYLYEAMLNTHATSVAAPTDPDATVPGHLPNELPGSAALDDEKGNPPEPGELDETDARMVDDDKGNGVPDPDDTDPDLKMAPHLKDDEKLSLGSPHQEKPDKSEFAEAADVRWLNREIKRYLMQEDPAGASMVDPVGAKGFYTPFDMSKDHHDGDDIDGFWYRSPGRTPGTDGDPKREEDPAAQLKMHPNANDPTTVHPAVSGKEGFAALRVPEIPSLTGGGDTSTMLGPSAKPGGGGVSSSGESQESGESESDASASGESDQEQS